MANINGAVVRNGQVTGSIRETLLKGLSAYEVAVKDGYTGTEEEWLASLKGETGAAGQKGDTGNGIKNAVLNSDYTLTLTFTDGTSYTTAPIRGLQGERGEKGDRGETGQSGYTPIKGVDYFDGATGPQGETGNGIQSAVLNADYTLTLTFTDGTSYTTESIRGATGPQGPKGDRGETGACITEAVSGTAPVIVAEDNHRYVCGEVTSLSFTPCASGICDVIFTSGSTVAVLTLPSTVKMPEGFEVESNTTYEINILDGVYGSVMSWT